MGRKKSNTLFEAYCGALCVLSKRRDDEAGICQSREVLVRHAIVEMAKTPITSEVVRYAISTCEMDILEALETREPGVVANWFKEDKLRNAFADLAGHASPAFLIRLRSLSHGRALTEYHLLYGIVGRDDLDGFLLALSGMPAHAPFHSGHYLDFNFIAMCGPRTAPEMARRLVIAQNTPDSTVRRMMDGYTPPVGNVKTLAVFTLMGVDLTWMLSWQDGTGVPREMKPILQKAMSNHGQLELLRQDVLIDALGRHETGMFLGVKGRRY